MTCVFEKLALLRITEREKLNLHGTITCCHIHVYRIHKTGEIIEIDQSVVFCKFKSICINKNSSNLSMKWLECYVQRRIFCSFYHALSDKNRVFICLLYTAIIVDKRSEHLP